MVVSVAVVTFGVEKLEWCGYPDGERFLKICLFVSTKCTNVTNGRTDRQIRHRMTA